MTALLRPAVPARGARVALVAPAGPLSGEDILERAEENVRSLGWEPVRGINALNKTSYLAGSDDERRDDLNCALSDSGIDAIWCLRGGYGSMRLLPSLEYAALRVRPRPVIGYSDITALHAAIHRNCQIISYHGPTAREELTDFSRTSLTKALHGENSCGGADNARSVREGRATGRLAGGNLAMLAAIVGTPFAADLDDAIVVMEDVGEPMYRVDRLFQQLLLSGALERARAIVFGHCTDCEVNTPEAERQLDAILSDVSDRLSIPCIAGVPVGHIREQWTVPLGAMATLDTGNRTLDVQPF